MSLTRSFLSPVSRIVSLSVATLGFFTLNAQALDLDWQGQFRAETHTLFGYSHENVAAGTTTGYSIPNNGDSPANFQTLFFSLRPKVLVNDNVSILSDLWFNAPDSGIFGGNSTSGGTYSLSRTSNGLLSARTFYAEVATDFGTFRVGRVPLNYGLGLVWNSGYGKNSRLPSNGDAIGMTTKFGAFKFSPMFVKYQQLSIDTLGVNAGSAGITDYTLGLSYTNDDEQLDVGLLFMRRLAGINSGVVDPSAVFAAPASVTAGYAYNIWDFYAKKKAGIFTFATEVPLASGLVASKAYSTVAGAVQASAAVTDHWTVKANAGLANGQGSDSSKLTAFSFHPDYRPGLLMFNYNYRNLSTGSGSYFDDSVSNAKFLAVSGDYVSGKFSHGLLGLFAIADQTAAAGATPYFNHQSGHYETATAGAPAQSSSMGLEMDYSLGYDWDEYTHFGIDTGLYFPGAYFAYSATSTSNTQKTVFGTSFNMMVKF